MSRQLLKSTMVVSAMTSLSRVFGLVRDIVIARYFGAGLGVDAFIVAFRIPNFLRRLFAEGGFSQAFVPVLAEYRERRGHDEVQALVDQTAATLGLVLMGVTAAGVLAAPLLVMVFAPGFLHDAAKTQLATGMLRVTFPYIFFISLTALAGGILNTYRRFAVPAFTPVLLNLSMIGCAVWLSPRFAQPVTALAWGVLIAGVVQLLCQFPFLLRLRLLPKPRLHRDPAGTRRIIRLMLPTLFAVSVTQINLVVDTVVASFLVTGSISWLYYSDRLAQFPLGVFGVALATVVMPSLSAQHARGTPEEYSRTLDWALRWVIMIMVPAACGLALLAVPLLTTLFQYKSFSSFDVVMTSRSLIAYTVGLPAFVLIKVLASAFFARQDTRTPVEAGVASMVSNIVLILLLVLPLAHAGLALATSIASYVNAGVLYWHLHRRGQFRPAPGWLPFLCKVTLAVAAMAALLLLLTPGAAHWQSWSAPIRAGRLAVYVFCGAGCYFGMLWLSGMRPAEMTSPP